LAVSFDELLAQLGNTVEEDALSGGHIFTTAPSEDLMAQLMAAIALARPVEHPQPAPPAQYTQPDLKSGYRTSAPLPMAYKADVNTRKGIVTAYLSVYKDPATGQDFVDSYSDIIDYGCFSKTINDLNQARRAKNTSWLCPDLWQHDRKEPIGGIKGLTEDSKGVIYEVQLFLNLQRARDCLELCEKSAIGSSFGYDPDEFYFSEGGDIRHLKSVTLHEVSQVTFPANPHAPILGVKSFSPSRFYMPSSYPASTRQPAPQAQRSAPSQVWSELSGHSSRQPARAAAKAASASNVWVFDRLAAQLRQFKERY
jgi:HK97 family phage prohead protease